MNIIVFFTDTVVNPDYSKKYFRRVLIGLVYAVMSTFNGIALVSLKSTTRRSRTLSDPGAPQISFIFVNPSQKYYAI